MFIQKVAYTKIYEYLGGNSLSLLGSPTTANSGKILCVRIARRIRISLSVT